MNKTSMKRYIVTGVIALIAVGFANRVPQVRRLMRN